jgi:hypothetical protein
MTTRTLLTAAVLALATSACGNDASAPSSPTADDRPWTRVAAATGADALPDGALLRINVEWVRETWEEDIHAEEAAPHEFSEPHREHYVIDISGAHVRHWEDAGVPFLRVVRGDTGWTRAGAIVVDLTAPEAGIARAEPEDWMTLLGATDAWDGLETTHDPALESGSYVVSGDARPTRRVAIDPESSLPLRIDVLPGNAPADALDTLGTLTPVEWREWDGAAGVRFPAMIEREFSRGPRTTIERTRVLTVELLDPATGRLPARPASGGRGELGAPRPQTVKSSSALLVRREARLTEIPGSRRLLRDGVAATKAGRRGADLLSFEGFPDERGIATFSVLCRVSLSHEADAANPPAGVISGRHTGGSFLVFPYTGPIPQDAALQERVEAEARKLGVEPAGAALFAIASEPLASPPNAVPMEIYLPVEGHD